jgi:hypothetical protein
MGKYLNMIRQAEKTQKQTCQDKEHVQGNRGPVEALPLVPGTRITWQRADGTEQRGVVDFLQTDADGSVWAFCTRPDGVWCAVNTKYNHGYDGRTRRAES